VEGIERVPQATEATLSVLKGGDFDFAIVGGLAVILRGHSRYTRDIDALVWELDDRLEEFALLLSNHGFQPLTQEQMRQARTTRVLHTVWQEDIYVDFMLGFLPLERAILDAATSMEIGPALSTKVATAEDLVIMKLIASRERDINDVIALKEIYPGLNRERIRAVVSDYAETLERPEIADNLNRFFPDSPPAQSTQ